MTVKFRPFVREFLKNVYKYWNIAVFTASAKEYAYQIVNSLDPKKELIFNILCRDHCTFDRDGNFIKDLRTITNFDLNRTVIVDNKLISYAFDLKNGIPILPFYGDKNDTELKYLLQYLRRLSKEDEILPNLKNRYDYEQLYRSDKV